MADGSKILGENEVMLELSIGGIFGESKKTNQITIESVEKDDRIEDLNVQSKRQIQVLRRRELRRKREEKLKKTVDFGSCGSVSGPFVEDKEWLETQTVQRNDVGLEIEPARKKERIESYGLWPMACRSFRPSNMNLKPDEDEIDGGGRRICKVKSNGSDAKCSSHQGVATDDSRSNNSINSQLDQQMASTSAPSTDPFDPYDQPTGSSKQTVSTTKLTNSTVSEPSPHESIVSNPPCKRDQTTIPHQHVSLLARKPCVSTTGNGPNGKTVSGFLYRYTKNEVSIVCVCHGHSFTPAGFVEHAGGVDIAHPLKHITIFPAAFAS